MSTTQCQVYCSPQVPAACHCPIEAKPVPTLDVFVLVLLVVLIATITAILNKGHK